MVDFKTLEAVVWIWRVGSFSAAAERMNTTQPAISYRIQQLEQQLGVQLFQRQKPRVLLTEKGREFVRYAEPILRLCSQMIEAVEGGAALTGRLRLGVVETIVQSWLPAFLRRMSEAHPGIELEINVDDTPSLRARLLAFELDLAFLSGTVEDAAVRAVPLSRSAMGFVAAPSIGLSGEAGPADLARWPIISFSRTSHVRPVLDALFGAPGLPVPKIHTSTSLATIVQMALDGLGIAFLPLAIVEKELAGGRLAVIPATMAIPDIAFSACWLATPEMALAARAAEVAAAVAGPGHQALRSSR